MAKCPVCKKEWQWNVFCRQYHEEGTETVMEEEAMAVSEDGTIETILQKCSCGKVVSVKNLISGNTTVSDCMEWKDIDWGLSENRYGF